MYSPNSVSRMPIRENSVWMLSSVSFVVMVIHSIKIPQLRIFVLFPKCIINKSQFEIIIWMEVTMVSFHTD